jgi:hypothetical protein
MWGTKIHYRHMWARGAGIEEATHEGRPWVRILAAAKRMIFARKVPRLRSWQLFDLKSSCGPYRANRPVGVRLVLNDLGRRNYQNESCRSLKFMKLCSWRLFNLKSSCGPYRTNRPIGRPLAERVLNDLRWRNNQNESCRSRKVMKLCSWQHFLLKSFWPSKNQFMLSLVYYEGNQNPL